MRIGIASGKGGTGKTTVATSLAWVAGRAGRAVAYLDCDVEEPNGALFLRPTLAEPEPVTTLAPRVDTDRCTGCGACGRACQFSAILAAGQAVLTFPELCHGCGACSRACPVGAITERPRPVGLLRQGRAGAIWCVEGELAIGEAMSPPVIRAVKRAAPAMEITLLDCPPGTSCAMVEAVRDCDHVLLVTEPTPFGLHDLRLAVETLRLLYVPFGVIVNRCDSGDERVRRYCREESIEILAEIPDRRDLAEAYARGQVLAEISPEVAAAIEPILTHLTGAPIP